ncbi:M23 family metallopeptidase [Chitinilyticum piscinae]|uniref:M23 family metallopeptidase n=1 Tax=Chitinilyticum piscinae TaxID=2866724 RepID=A0A8J7K808_9NEIS|nr:M23 family metallopeptidase [Chitinilyticum piscinae]MBE9608863.1 M23 family metallopeptidase [Chitinilyticum piscinae]
MRRTLIAAASLASLVTLSAYGVAELAPIEKPQQQTIRTELELPELQQRGQTASPARIQETVLRRGDTLAAALHRIGANTPDLLRTIRAERSTRDLLELAPGRILSAEFADDGELHAIRYLNTGGTLLEVRQIGGQWQSSQQTPPPLIGQQHMNGLISKDFSSDFAALGLSAVNIRQLEEIRSNPLLGQTSQPGSRFIAITEQASIAGERYGERQLRALRLQRGDTVRDIYWFDGKPYLAGGEPLLPALLATPAEDGSVSSSFAMRIHPILGVWMQHKGTDFAAAAGKQIFSAGDGIVLRTGVDGGYGIFVEIDHGKGITTLYGHMQATTDTLKAGQRLRQGDVIGFVGSTGRSTGPHLHYEIRRNGEALPPEILQLPPATRLAGSNLERFSAQLPALRQQLATLAGYTTLARLTPEFE